jgi:MFS family permease
MVQTLIYGTLAFLGIASVGIQQLALKTKTQISSGKNPEFLQFQRKFFAVYFLALFSDWLQGPYVYKLYSHYGFAESQIAVLYVFGFGASILFGTATGPLADRFGRKMMCISFSVLYSICCLTKLSSDFFVLLLGRILGGISTSMLFSSFEAWYVYEHVEKYGFPTEWIPVTLSKVTYWNGLLAIIAGIVSNFVAEVIGWGPIAPFMLAVPCLVATGVAAAFMWTENCGANSTHFSSSCLEGLRQILSNSITLQLGLVQSLFEAVIYIFVFLWTPILEPVHPPLGIVFSCFMVCIMIGSSLYSLLLSKQFKCEKVLVLACVLAFVCTSICAFSTNGESPHPYMSFFAFLLLEVAVGLYYPAIGSLRSQVLPEAYRANIINWFRVPMNLITCSALLWLHGMDSEDGHNVNRKMFVMCSGLLVIATVIGIRFSRSFVKEIEEKNSLIINNVTYSS